MLKNNSGVSLIQVIIAIIIIIIITSFAIWYASNTSTEAKLTKIYSEITAVKEGYDNLKVLGQINPTLYSLEDLEVSELDLSSSNYSDVLDLISDKSELYLVNSDNADVLEIEKERITQEFIIDGLTGNVYLVGGFARSESQDLVYEYKDIVAMYSSTFR